jgi:hypothetical protein
LLLAAAVRSKICKELQTAAISKVTFVPAQRTISMGYSSPGETREQIGDRAFDIGHMRDGAGGGSDGHTSQGSYERQRGNRKE